MRQEGYYWVKYRGKWEIAKWMEISADKTWMLPAYIGGDTWWMDDSDFDEIDENRIVRPEPHQLSFEPNRAFQKAWDNRVVKDGVTTITMIES